MIRTMKPWAFLKVNRSTGCPVEVVPKTSVSNRAGGIGLESGEVDEFMVP